MLSSAGMKTAEDRLSARRPSVGRGRVLIVDDDPGLGQTIRWTLGRHGYQAEVLSDGSQVSAWLQRDDVVAVVLDLRLRHGHGRDLLQEIRQMNGFGSPMTYLGIPNLSPEVWFEPTTVFCVMQRGGATDHLLESVAEACRVASQARQPRCA